MPASCKPILNSLSEGITGWQLGELPPVTEELKQGAKHAILIIEERLTPAPTDGIKAAVFTLISHFYMNDMPDAVYQGIAQDWIHCLKKYPAWAIEQARIEYLSTTDRKPKPYNIVKLCSKAIAKDNALRVQCNNVINSELSGPKEELTDEQRKAAQERVAEIVRGAKTLNRMEVHADDNY